jgi:hypothetical protein
MLTRAALLVLLGPVVAAAAPFVLSQTVVSPNPAAGDFFACSVASVGSAIVIGARFEEDAGATDAGAAYVLDGGTLRRLASPAPAAGAQFGYAVAGLGDRVAVGAPHADSGQPHAGTVYVFDAASGGLLLTIPNPTPAFDDLFGFAVAAVGSNLLVGAPGANEAYVFDAGTGALLETLTDPAGAAFDLFGAAVAGVGGQALVGAPLDDTEAANAGAAYVFDAGTGALLRTLTSPRPHAGDLFGSAVAGAGTAAAIGVPFDGSVASNGGAVYLFDATSGALLRELVDPDPAADDRFGSAVAALGSDVLVGAPFKDTTAPDVGVAYLLSASSGDVLQQFDNPTPAAGDQFGASLAAVGTSVAVGSWLDDTAADNGGALYVFVDLGTPSTTTSTSTTVTDTSLTTTTATTVTAPPSSTASTSTTTSSTDTVAPDSTTTATTTADTTTETTATETTTVPADSSSTTTEPSAVPTLCNDNDPCTDDRWTVAGGCQYVPIGGFTGATCRLDALSTLLRGVPRRALGGRSLAGRLAARVAATRRLVAAASLAPAHATARLERATGTLARFMAVVRRAERRGTVARPLAESLLAFAADASGRIARLL